MRIWFNRHFVLIARVIRQLRDAPQPLPLSVLVSHRHRHFTGFAEADEAFLEPEGLTAEDYLQWCLQTVSRRRVEYLVPGHEQSFLSANAAAFRALGCRIIHAAPANLLPLLHRKDWVYQSSTELVNLPPYRVVTAPEQLRPAIEALEQGEYDEVCIKPCVSVYGKGFGRITAQDARAGAERDHVDHWLAKNVHEGTCARQLVMRFLPGHEYSVDIAARDGELLAAVVRRKPISGSGQLLQHNPVLIEAARAMVAQFKLNAMVNIQFRDDVNGRPRLLEINPRASGGIGMSCMSGINLPDIALRAAILPGYSVPPLKPLFGVRVAEISRAVIVPEPEADEVTAGSAGEPRAA
jgi:hypothetical protein